MLRRSTFTLPLTLSAAAFAAPPNTPAMAAKITVFGHDWDVISAEDWRVSGTGTAETLELVTARPQEANPRRPIQFALARTPQAGKFTLEVEVKRCSPKGSLILVYAWRKDGYFDYVHLSDDSSEKVEVHNGIFHCYGGDRVRISPTVGPATLLSEDWHPVRVDYDPARGLVEAWVDGRSSPSLKAVDLSLSSGRIGVGSFFNTASFRNLRITS